MSEFKIYRGEPIFTGSKAGSWWSPFPDKAQNYRHNPFYGHFEKPFKSGNPGKVLKATTNLDDFKKAMQRVIVKHHTNSPNPIFTMPDRPYMRMSVDDAFKQLDKDIADIKSGKTTLEKLSKTNALFKEGYFTGDLKNTLKPKIAWRQTLKPLIGPLADNVKEAAKTVGKSAIKYSGPIGIGYGAYDAINQGAFKPFYPDSSNPAHSHLLNMEQYREKIKDRLNKGPLYEER